MNTFAEITEIRNVKDSEGFSSKRETVLAFIRVYREGRHGSERWAKSELQKQIEKQMRQDKQLADRKRRDDEKRAREEKLQARKEAIRLQASTIIGGQPLIDGFRIMDSTAEEILQCLLKVERTNEYHICFDYDIFPEYVKLSISLELEKLIQYGMVSGVRLSMSGGMLDFLPTALSYFEDKESALVRKKKAEEKMSVNSITNYGNIVLGDVTNSTLTVDNSVREIERMIDERGGEDKEELNDILNEIIELLENIESSRSVPKQKRLFQRLTDHLAKHGWFYGAVIQLVGTTVIQMVGK